MQNVSIHLSVLCFFSFLSIRVAWQWQVFQGTVRPNVLLPIFSCWCLCLWRRQHIVDVILQSSAWDLQFDQMLDTSEELSGCLPLPKVCREKKKKKTRILYGIYIFQLHLFLRFNSTKYYLFMYCQLFLIKVQSVLMTVH